MTAIKGLVGFVCVAVLCAAMAGPAVAAANEATIVKADVVAAKDQQAVGDAIVEKDQAVAPKKAVKAKKEASTEAAYAEKGAQSCLKCHDEEPVISILNTPHAMKGDSRTPMAQHACESCHGASPEHMTTKGKNQVSPTVVFQGPKASSVEERNKMCLGCHEGGARMNWEGSKHQSSEVACASCHTIHATKDPVLVKATQADKCATCHAQRRADFFKLSHHPIKEGKVVCSDCHNQHGSVGPSLLKKASVNETCVMCHAEKRGPVLWEHPPVADNCMNCHTPHGSTVPRLLRERVPYLCQQCHNAAQHPGTDYNGNSLPPSAGGTGVTGAPQLMGKACLNCHSVIHGSNHPSGIVFQR